MYYFCVQGGENIDKRKIMFSVTLIFIVILQITGLSPPQKVKASSLTNKYQTQSKEYNLVTNDNLLSPYNSIFIDSSKLNTGDYAYWSYFAYGSSGGSSSLSVGNDSSLNLNYLHIQGNGINDNNDSGAMLRLQNLKQNTQYTISMYIKAASGTSWQNGLLSLTNQEGTAFMNITNLNNVDLSSDWIRISMPFNTGSNTRPFVRVSRGNHDWVNITGVKLEEGYVATPFVGYNEIRNYNVGVMDNIISPHNAYFMNYNAWSYFKFSGADSSISVREQGKNGFNYMHMEGSGFGDSGVAIGLGSFIQPNQDYTIGAWVRTGTYSAEGNGALFVVNQYGNAGVFSVDTPGGKSTNGGWTWIEGSFNSGNNRDFQIRLNRGNASYIDFSQITLRPGKDSIKISDNGYSGKLIPQSVTFAPKSMDPISTTTLLTSKNFDGISDYVDLGTLNYDFSRAFEISFTARWDSFQDHSRIFDFSNGDNNRENIAIYNRSTVNELVIQTHKDGYQHYLLIGNILTIGETADWKITFDNTGYCKVYKNNIVVGEKQLALPNRTNWLKNYIGKSNWPDQLFKGQISNFNVSANGNYQIDHHQPITTSFNRSVNLSDSYSDGQWYTDVSQMWHPGTISKNYFDSATGQTFNFNLSKENNPYVISSSTKSVPRTVYVQQGGWVYKDSDGSYSMYDPYGHTTLGYMSDNSSTYYGNSYSYDARPRIPKDNYLDAPDPQNWQLVDLWWADPFPMYWNPWNKTGTKWFSDASSNQVYNPYRKGVYLRYKKWDTISVPTTVWDSVPIYQAKVDYKGTFGLPDFVDHYDDYSVCTQWTMTINYAGSLDPVNLKANNINITDSNGNIVTNLKAGQTYNANVNFENNGSIDVTEPFNIGLYDEFGNVISGTIFNQNAVAKIQPVSSQNILNSYFGDVDFNTGKDGSKLYTGINRGTDNVFSVKLVDDAEASGGKAIEVEVLKDNSTWASAIDLGTPIPVEENKDYTLTTRIKMLHFESNTGVAEPGVFVWSHWHTNVTTYNPADYFIANGSTPLNQWITKTNTETSLPGSYEKSYGLGIGSVKAGTKFRLDFIAYEQTSTSSYVVAESPKYSTTIPFSVPVSGDHTITAWIDNNNNIIESDEADNTVSTNVNVYTTNIKTTSLSIVGLSDDVPMSSLEIGKQYRAKIGIRNDGSTVLPTFKVGLYGELSQLDEQTFSFPDPSSKLGSDYTVASGLSPGSLKSDVYITFTANSTDIKAYTAWSDNTELVEESNEYDNLRSLALDTLARNVIADYIKVVNLNDDNTPATLEQNKQYRLKYSITNDQETALIPLKVRISETTSGADKEIAVKDYQLNQMQTVVDYVVFTSNMGGNMDFKLMADSDDSYFETNESDNIKLTSAYVYSLLELNNFRITDMVNPPNSYTFPILTNLMPVGVKAGYNNTFAIDVKGSADTIEVKISNSLGQDLGIVYMTKLNDVDSENSVWGFDYATLLSTPINTIINFKITAHQGTDIHYDYNTNKSWNGDTLKVIGNALDDAVVNRVY
jgi:hypothetical protein